MRIAKETKRPSGPPFSKQQILLLKSFETDPRIRRKHTRRQMNENELYRQYQEQTLKNQGAPFFNEEPQLRKRLKLEQKDWEPPSSYLQFAQKFETQIKPENQEKLGNYLKITNIINQSSSRKQFFLKHRKLFERLYQLFSLQGGFVEAIAKYQLPNILKQLSPTDATSQDQDRINLFNIYKDFIYPYQVLKGGSSRLLQNLDFKLLNQVPGFTFQQHLAVPDFYNKIFHDQITNLIDFEPRFKFDRKFFCFDYLKKTYGSTVVDIRIQCPQAKGFEYNQKMNVVKYQMSVADYIEYQRVYCDPVLLQFFAHRAALQKNYIFFGVNVDIDSFQEFIQEFTTKLPSELLFKSKHDILRYLNKDIPGVTMPQFYLKVKGTWTGGHQQNVNLTAININHGPAESQWITVDFQHVPKLRQLVMKQFGIDIHKYQGLWYIPPEFCLERGVPVRKVYQKKGDVIILGPGCLHWVRSYGVSLQSAWNFMPINQNQIKAAIYRQKINKQLKFESVIVPLKNLLFNFYNEEYSEMPIQVRNQIREQLQKALQDQEKTHIQLGQQAKLKYVKTGESFCDLCKQQFFVYFVANSKIYICLDCWLSKESKEEGYHCFRLEPEKVRAALQCQEETLSDLKMGCMEEFVKKND